MRFLTASLSALLGAVLLAVPTASADSCRFVHGYSYRAAPVHYDYAQAYHDTVLVPYAVPVTIVPYTYFAVAPELAYARINQELADQAARKALADYIKNQPAPAAPTAVIPPAAAPPVPPAVEKKAPEGLAARVQAHANTSCVKCHGPQSGHAPDLTDVNKLDEETRLKILYRVMTDDPKLKMPKTGEPVTPEQLNDWHAFVGLAKAQPK